MIESSKAHHKRSQPLGNGALTATPQELCVKHFLRRRTHSRFMKPGLSITLRRHPAPPQDHDDDDHHPSIHPSINQSINQSINPFVLRIFLFVTILPSAAVPPLPAGRSVSPEPKTDDQRHARTRMEAEWQWSGVVFFCQER